MKFHYRHNYFWKYQVELEKDEISSTIVSRDTELQRSIRNFVYNNTVNGVYFSIGNDFILFSREEDFLFFKLSYS